MELNKIKYLENYISNWKFKQYENLRLYFLLTPENNGFVFYAVGNITSDIINYEWTEDEEVNILIHGWAAFDGVRHMHFGDPEDEDWIGYFNYPDMEKLISVLSTINDIQKMVCTDFR